MKVTYYPGCTLKLKAKNLEQAALASLQLLNLQVEELEKWNCCGAVYSLTDDDLIHQIAPVRDLIRAKEKGSQKLITLCSMCYNTLARANLLMQTDTEKRDTINRFMDEEIDYQGEVEVQHFLTFLKEEIGWDNIRKKVKSPLNMKLAAYYGCTLQRPSEIGIEPLGSFKLMNELLEALGAEMVEFDTADLCCGSYQLISDPKTAAQSSIKVLNSARQAGAEALVTSCPLCEYNLGQNQPELRTDNNLEQELPTFYFTQLLALALGADTKECIFELNIPTSQELLKAKNYSLTL